MSGPLKGVRIIELGGIGPAPFCGMMLADQGATVIRVERPGTLVDPRDPLSRSRRLLLIDLKHPAATNIIRALSMQSDGLIEGFRPGVAERLGLGPDVLLADNPRLVYGRMTGWGQDGPMANVAGHDINYIALSGVLHSVGVNGKPVPPSNYIGDFGGGAMMLAYGVVSALLAAGKTGHGQVIDCAMTDGSALIAALTYHLRQIGQLEDRPGVNLLDGGAHFYGVYECADGKFISIGAYEPQFYVLLRKKLGVLDDPAFDDYMNPAGWESLKGKVADIIKTRSRAEWCAELEGTDTCFAPVLSLDEAPNHPHNIARRTFIEVAGTLQPAPAPRFSKDVASPPWPHSGMDADTDEIMSAAGFGLNEIAEFRADGVIGNPTR